MIAQPNPVSALAYPPATAAAVVAPLPDWVNAHAGKVMSADDALKRVEPGTRLLIGSGAAEPVSLVHAMVRAPQLADNEVVHILTLGPAPYVAPEQADRFRHTAFFIGHNVREAVNAGRADFVPVFLHEIPRLIRERRVRVDTALIQVSPPDRHGYVSLGVSVDVVRAAVDSAARIIAEVNPNVPRTHGDSYLHVDRIDALVPCDAPLLTLDSGTADEVSVEIGRQVASLIPDGATLQLGIGKIPDSVLAALTDRKELGIHTEMLSDGVMRLAELGVITGRKKTLLPGKMVTSFIMGSEQLYRWADDNPAIEMRGSEFTNDPFTIARNDGMIAVNSALAVDLTGQVAADTRSGLFFSGIGGQVDFIRGAARSKGGKPIIALPSTAKKGTISRITPAMEAGAGIVTSRGDVHYVVTEYGVADLWGKSVRERALALIAIAHPDFRGELLAAAKARKYILPAQAVPRGKYPAHEQKTVELKKTRDRIVLRPIRITDARCVQELLYRCSDDSVYRRFQAHRRTHTDESVREMVDVDYVESMGLLAIPEGTDEVIAIARYDVSPATQRADVALLVRDDWQRRGVGQALLQRMIENAKSRGLAGLELDILAGNASMLQLLSHSGLPYHGKVDGGVHHFVADFPRGGTAKSAP